jgi:two-component system sensor histidine kinase RegB
MGGTVQPPERADEHANRTNLAWLLRLRWGAIAGQAATILGVERVMGIALPLLPLFAIVGVELLSNAALARWARARMAVPERVLVLVLTGDILLLTALLHLTGGPFNPFNFLYLVHIALAAVVLRSRWTWTLAGLSFACFGALFLEQSFFGADAHAHAGHTDMRMHLYGMWIAFGVAAVFIVYFVTRVSRDLARREQELREARALAAQSERLAALATLAAGAAHELSSPLSTIAVAAKELERDLERASSAGKSADARLIREEVARCRAILTRMAAHAAPDAGGASEISAEQLLDAALSALPDRARIAIAIDERARGCRLLVPPHALAQALRCVLENAQQAVAGGGEVSVRVAIDEGTCLVEVTDSGAGMTPEVLARAGEPFYTTKPPGHGMGLGLFVSRAALERIGGRLELRSQPGRGSVATLRLPLPPSGREPQGADAGAPVATPERLEPSP